MSEQPEFEDINDDLVLGYGPGSPEPSWRSSKQSSVTWPAATMAVMVTLFVIAGIVLVCLGCFGVFGNPGLTSR